MKLEFPRFWGENPTAWVYKANQYFKYYNVSPNEQLALASFHMDGEAEALVWYQDCEESGISDLWETPVQALLLMFGTTSYDAPMEDLTRLRLSNRIRGLSPQHKLSCFLSGLKDEVRLPVVKLSLLYLVCLLKLVVS